MSVTLDSNIIFYLVTALFSAYIVLVGFLSKRKDASNPMSISYTRNLKGVMATIVLFHHFAIRMEGLYAPFKIFCMAGPYAVSAFLFISGYSEAYQMNKKGLSSYSKNFLTKKMFRIYLPWLWTTLLFLIAFNVKDIRTVLQGIFLFKTVYRQDTFNWFVILIVLYYIAIYLYIRSVDHIRHANPIKTERLFWMVIVGLSAAWFIITIASHCGNNWYVNSFTFPLGCFFGRYREECSKFFYNKAKRKLALLIVLFGILLVLQTVNTNEIVETTALILNMFVTALIVWQISLFIDFESKGLIFLGNLSLEIFLLGTGIFVFYYSHFAPSAYSIFIIAMLVLIISKAINAVAASCLKVFSSKHVNQCPPNKR